MGQQFKKKTATFSLTEEEKAALWARSEYHGFAKPSHYLIALVEADATLGLEATLEVGADGKKRHVLRPRFAAIAAETAAPYTVPVPKPEQTQKRKSAS